VFVSYSCYGILNVLAHAVQSLVQYLFCLL
jgi:hypothetical protein